MSNKKNNENLNIFELLTELNLSGLKISLVSNEQLEIVGDELIIESHLPQIQENKIAIINYLSGDNLITFQQESILLANISDPQNSRFNVPFLLKGLDNCNIEQFTVKLKEFILGCPSLHVNFYQTDREFRAVINTPKSIEIQYVSIDEKTVDTWAKERTKEPFDLSKDPLFRIFQVYTTAGYYFLLIFHHLIIDGYSAARLFSYLSKKSTFNISDNITKNCFPSNYIASQRQDYLLSDIKETQSYWYRLLEDYGITSLFIENPYDVNENNKYSTLQLEHQTYNKLKERCLYYKSSMSTFLLTTFYQVICRISDSADHIIMIPMNVLSENNLLITNATDTYPIRLQDYNQLDFSEMLRVVEQTVHESYDFVAKTPKALFGYKVPSLTSVYEGICFNFFNQSELTNSLQKIGLEQVNIAKLFSEHKYKLAIYVFVDGNSITINFVSNSSKLSNKNLHEIQKLFMLQLNSNLNISNQRNHPVTNNDIQSVMKTLPNQSLEHINIYSYFYEMALKFPNNVAIISSDLEINYHDLLNLVDLICNMLSFHNIKSRDLIFIDSDRSIYMVALMLACLRNNYIFYFRTNNLDNDIEELQQDFREVILISTTNNHFTVTDFNSEKSYFYNVDELVVPANNEKPVFSIQSDTPAYIFSTSGTTGSSKKILGKHSSLTNFIVWQKSLLNVDVNDTVAQIANPTFDAILREILLPLCSGAKLVICPSNIRYTNIFLDWIFTNKITILHTVPSVFKHFLQKTERSILNDQLRYLMFSGESFDPEIISLMSTNFKMNELNIINFYGCTEATMIQGYSYINKQAPYLNSHIIENTASGYYFSVCNEDLNVVEQYEIGEIVISSNYLSLGYLNNPKQTAKSFLIQNNREDNNYYTYLTGDIGYYDFDNNLHIIGRKDDNVKINGIKFNLNNLEKFIRLVSGIKECSVVYKQQIYIFISTNDDFDIESLLVDLNNKFSYAPPVNHFYRLNEFPITSNGKVDRTKLLSMINSNLVTTFSIESQEISLTDFQEEVKCIWLSSINKSVSELNSLNYFSLGGGSLSALQAIADINNKFDLKLLPDSIFQYPNLISFCNYLMDIKKNKCQSIVLEKHFLTNYPASYQQFRIWMMTKVDADPSHYNSNIILNIEGDLNINTIESALFSIYKKHTVLRTKFSFIENQLIQTVCSEDGFVLENIADFSLENLRSIINIPFDLSEGINARFYINIESSNICNIIIVIHHIAYDLYSKRILIKDFYDFYTRQTNLTDVLQYYDFSMWQHEYYNGGHFDSAINYFENHLKNSKQLRLSNKTSSNSYSGGLYPIELSMDSYSSILKLASCCSTTPYNVLLTVYIVFLSCEYAQTDITIGMQTAARMHDAAGIFGYFANLLPIRLEVEYSKSLEEHLSQIHSTLIKLQQFQFLPYELIKGRNQEAHLNDNIFNSLFSFQDLPHNETLESNGIKITDDFMPVNNVSDFDLSFYITSTSISFVGYIQYKKDLFEEQEIEDIFNKFSLFLNLLLRSPYTSIQENLDDIYHKESYKPVPLKSCILADYYTTLPSHLNDIALRLEKLSLTYQELENYSNWIVDLIFNTGLIKSNPAPGSFVVGIMFERSMEMFSTILALLKCNVAFLPIDKNLPFSRISYMVTHADLDLFICNEQAHFISKEIAKIGIQILHLPNYFESQTKAYKSNNTFNYNNNSTTYVLYTSGSTGKPKAVPINGYAIYNRLCWMKDYLNITHDDVLFQKTPYTFDVSIWELYLPLITKCQLVIAQPDLHADPSYLYRTIIQENITIMHFVPSMLECFLDFLVLNDYNLKNSTLRAIVCSGEALSIPIAHRASKILCKNIYNLYGPTEAAIDVSFFKYTPDLPFNYKYVPIGKAIQNIKLYVLDENLKACDILQDGELYITGIGLSEGYLNSPKLTADKFVLNPFQKTGDIYTEKMYKTGDIVCLLPDGNIQYKGRVDSLVKLNGIRVELQEIESCIKNIPGIVYAAVILKSLDGGDKLVAFYSTSQNGSEVTTNQIKSSLANFLPDYMIPKYIYPLNDFPFLSSGKVDRNALNELYIESTPQSETKFSGTDLQIKIFEIWKTVLQKDLKSISIESNFFTIGGDSLDFISMITQVNTCFNVNFDLTDVIDTPTILAISELIELIGSLDDDFENSEFLI